MQYTTLGQTGLVASRLTLALLIINMTRQADKLKRLDDLTAPIETYPNWFNSQTFDLRLADTLTI